MLVREVMTQRVTWCRLGATLATAASRMWLADCGALPVLDDAERVVGIITDRDICFALAWKQKPAGEVLVEEVIEGKPLYTCTAETDTHDALRVMRERHVRRLPVVDANGRLTGILSITDALLHTEVPRTDSPRELPVLPADEVMGTLKSVCGPTVKVQDEVELHA